MPNEGRRVNLRNINLWVAGIAIAAGVGAALAGPSPTGSTVIDFGLLLVVVAFSVLVIAAAPWSYPWQGTKRPLVAALVVGVVVQMVSRIGNLWFFGLSSIVGVLPILLVSLIAIHRQTGRRRVLLWSALGGLVAAGLLALLGFGVAAAGARPNLTRGADEAKKALRLLKAGDLEQARLGFQTAAGVLASANDDLSAPWAQPARLIPVVAQHRRAASNLAESAESASKTIVDVLGQIDFNQLRVVNGTIDINAITALRGPLVRLDDALRDLRSTVDSVGSPWLANPVRTRLATFGKELDIEQAESDRARSAVEQAPAMLGGKGKRVYFIAFTTPAEARGLGGFMGNWAEVTIDAGHISVTGFGRTADLAVNGDTEHWVRITSSPHFPEVAKSIADGYPAFSGHAVDGVFAMDVYTVAALMQLTGPIDLTSIGQTVSATNAAKFLLSDQYALVQDRAERIDLLEEVARTTIDRLLSTPLPAPPELIKLLSPYAAQNRLVGWSTKASEESLFERMNMSGELPTLDGRDGLAVVVNNVGNNKVDYYLTGEVVYTVNTNPKSGTMSAALDITLHNDAPVDVTEPGIVFANSEGAPPGTNVMELSVYTVLPVTEITIDGAVPPAARSSSAHGFRVETVDVRLAAQSTMKIEVQLAGPMDLSDGYHAIIRNGASANPLPTTVVVDRVAVKDSNLVLPGLHLIDP
jgi:hypothetical protein